MSPGPPGATGKCCLKKKKKGSLVWVPSGPCAVSHKASWVNQRRCNFDSLPSYDFRINIHLFSRTHCNTSTLTTHPDCKAIWVISSDSMKFRKLKSKKESYLSGSRSKNTSHELPIKAYSLQPSSPEHRLCVRGWGSSPLWASYTLGKLSPSPITQPFKLFSSQSLTQIIKCSLPSGNRTDFKSH